MCRQAGTDCLEFSAVSMEIIRDSFIGSLADLCLLVPLVTVVLIPPHLVNFGCLMARRYFPSSSLVLRGVPTYLSRIPNSMTPTKFELLARLCVDLVSWQLKPEGKSTAVSVAHHELGHCFSFTTALRLRFRATVVR